jgi:hypothetical protein
MTGFSPFGFNQKGSVSKEERGINQKGSVSKEERSKEETFLLRQTRNPPLKYSCPAAPIKRGGVGQYMWSY